MREIKKIILHCTDSKWGDVKAIDAWHRQRGWDGIGYHYVILNAYPAYTSIKEKEPVPENDGLIIEGRPLWKVGAHCRGHNYDSVGIAVVGVDTFSKAQLYSAAKLVKLMMKQFGLGVDNVYGHYEFNSYKSCPNINMNWFRSFLRGDDLRQNS